jgi:hypothetical protein
MSLVRQMRGGRDYDATWGSRMKGEGPFAALVADRFRAATRRHGLERQWTPLRTDLFTVPRPDTGQLDLFG